MNETETVVDSFSNLVCIPVEDACTPISDVSHSHQSDLLRCRTEKYPIIEVFSILVLRRELGMWPKPSVPKLWLQTMVTTKHRQPVE